ncbi:hypothetical protein K1T73_07080 [Roseovarius sp. SCSIO 43702]|uniref:hypothetical protein n=1 Tax=Roseovarius sp. SCSIO 43702 TaxID=2823043 RepID=UPI001C7378CB|nr:hypothetical protein [Roseovarius sp. SCSIO 43702]QYX58122.1 hypothetical protein K1T73_07080 [Roseovarius sp. SCSIO 43702]
MTSNAGCWRQRLAALAIGTSLLSGCATVGSDGSGPAACPPVVEYGREIKVRATDELGTLSDRSAIAELLADYGVMRDQARACSGQ